MASYWKIHKDGTLEFDDTYEGPIELPQGVTSCRAMFAGKVIKPGCFLHDFDTSNVTDFEGMFKFASIPADFNFPAEFTTKYAKTMRQMFLGCHFEGGFILTQQIVCPKFCDCSKMFEKVKFEHDFTFQDNFTPFDAGSVEDMFKDAVITNEVEFGEGFRTFSPQCRRDGMFDGAKLPAGISNTSDPIEICKALSLGVVPGSSLTEEDKMKALDAMKRANSIVADVDKATLAEVKTAAADSIKKRTVPAWAIDCIDSITKEARENNRRNVPITISPKFLENVADGVDNVTAIGIVRDLFAEMLYDLNSIYSNYSGENAGVVFDTIAYLKEKFGDKFSLVPSASVNNCESKEDCDDLYNRLSTML